MEYRFLPIFEFLGGCFSAFYAVKTVLACRKGSTNERFPSLQIAGFTTMALGAWLVSITHFGGLPRALWFQSRITGLVLLISALVLLLLLIALDLIRRLQDE